MNSADEGHHLYTLLLSVVKAISLWTSDQDTQNRGKQISSPSRLTRSLTPLCPASPTWISKPKVWLSVFSKVSTFLQKTQGSGSQELRPESVILALERLRQEDVPFVSDLHSEALSQNTVTKTGAWQSHSLAPKDVEV